MEQYSMRIARRGSGVADVYVRDVRWVMATIHNVRQGKWLVVWAGSACSDMADSLRGAVEIIRANTI